MSTSEKFESVTVQVTVNASIEKIWEYWTSTSHIPHWNFASEDWHAPSAENNLIVNGTFSYRMEAKDGSMGFDFEGVYSEVIPLQKIEYKLADERKVAITFQQQETEVLVTETFDAETENPIEMQRLGWQAILDNFKKYVETA
jgi:uncharacterized protein YndB with AHSA1/START domain